MSQYKVINRFKEKQHDGHIYEMGDVYPVEGKKLVKARADFLTKTHAEYGVAFLVTIEPPKKEEKEPQKVVKSDAE